MRRPNNTLSGGSGSRAARVMPIAAVALALIAVWVLAITMLGGQEKASSEAPVPPATTTEAAEPAAAPEDGAPESGSDPGGSEEPEAVEVERETPAPQSVPKKPVGQVIPEEPPTYNPLGKEIGPNDLTETQRGRVQLAASQFVVHAYGFTGKGEKAGRDYEAGISRSVVAPVFYESPGAGALAKLARQIESEGVQATAYLDSFEASQAAPEKVRGTARFTVESPSGRKSYAQELLLENSGAIWRVEQAGEIQGGGR